MFAPQCVACTRLLDRPLSGPVCDHCWQELRPMPLPICARCGDALASWRVISLSTAICPRCRRAPGACAISASAGSFEGTLRHVIHAFKYEGRRSLATPLAARMRAAGASILHGAAYVVPVPLHPWRRIQRGFNQAADLAAGLETPVWRALCRVAPTRVQTGLSAAARRRNVRGAFRLAPWTSLGRRRLEGAVIVLVDDVQTTGATLDACARVLLDAGAGEVRALTAARAPLHHAASASLSGQMRVDRRDHL